MDDRQKYIKYKTKYLKLLNKLDGGYKLTEYDYYQVIRLYLINLIDEDTFPQQKIELLHDILNKDNHPLSKSVNEELRQLELKQKKPTPELKQKKTTPELKQQKSMFGNFFSKSNQTKQLESIQTQQSELIQTQQSELIQTQQSKSIELYTAEITQLEEKNTLLNTNKSNDYINQIKSNNRLIDMYNKFITFHEILPIIHTHINAIYLKSDKKPDKKPNFSLKPEQKTNLKLILMKFDKKYRIKQSLIQLYTCSEQQFNYIIDNYNDGFLIEEMLEGKQLELDRIKQSYTLVNGIEHNIRTRYDKKLISEPIMEELKQTLKVHTDKYFKI